MTENIREELEDLARTIATVISSGAGAVSGGGTNEVFVKTGYRVGDVMQTFCPDQVHVDAGGTWALCNGAVVADYMNEECTGVYDKLFELWPQLRQPPGRVCGNMIGLNTPSPYSVSSSSANASYPAWQAFATSKSTVGWKSAGSTVTTSNGNCNEYIAINLALANASVVNFVTVEGNVCNWVVSGKPIGGTEFVELFTVVGQPTLSSQSANNTSGTYDISAIGLTAAWLELRVTVTKTATASTGDVQIFVLRFTREDCAVRDVVAAERTRMMVKVLPGDGEAHGFCVGDTLRTPRLEQIRADVSGVWVLMNGADMAPYKNEYGTGVCDRLLQLLPDYFRVMQASSSATVVTASSEANSSYPARSVIAIDNTAWMTTPKATANAATTEWVQLDLGAPTCVGQFAIAGEINGICNFTILASNDATSFVTVCAVVGETWATSGQVKQFFVMPQHVQIPYRYFKLSVTGLAVAAKQFCVYRFIPWTPANRYLTNTLDNNGTRLLVKVGELSDFPDLEL